MLSSTLRGAISQRLVPRPTGDGRIAVCEIMVATGRIQDLILNPEETGKITEVIAEGEFYGMQTFDQSLLKAVIAGDVSEEVAMEAASSPHDFKLMLAAQGGSGSRAGQGRSRRTGASPTPASPRRRSAIRAPESPPRPATSLIPSPRRAGFGPARRKASVPEALVATIGFRMHDPDCPVSCCAEIISGKWTLLVIRDLADGSGVSVSWSVRSRGSARERCRCACVLSRSTASSSARPTPRSRPASSTR